MKHCQLLALLLVSLPGPVLRAAGSVPLSFLEKHCITCHGDKKPKGNLNLVKYHDDATILEGRKVWEAVVEKVRAGEMPPPKRPRPAAGEIETFVSSVEGLFAHADKNARPDPGRVTVRRLNRTEYNNTIRDLVGVDFQPAEDFPADDIGHGFDNIGDVLSLSPVLLERYLAAAESIMQRAILVGPPPKPARRPVIAQFLLPRGKRDVRFRLLEDKSELHAPWRLQRDGEYRLHVRAWGRQVGDEPVKMLVRMDGKEVLTVEVRAVEGKAQTSDVLLKLAPGQHKADFVLLNPFTDPKAAKPEQAKRALALERAELEGPLDTYPPSHRRLLGLTGKLPGEPAHTVLGRFATRAYRRPATETEVDRLVRLFEDAQGRGESREAAFRFAMQAVLVSPKFLFRLELDDRPDSDGPRPLDEYQLASRLSYFLWSTMPDEELFELAGKKQLTANLAAQVRRMLRDPKAQALVDNFAMQWLQVRRLALFAPDSKMFPNFDEKLRADMLKETELFVASIFREDRSILELIDADYTFVNERLARHYGIVDTKGNVVSPTRQRGNMPGGDPIYGEQFRRVAVGDSGRGGLLTQASVLSVTSNPTRTSPVKRGRWVLEQLLGTPPPPPPPDVPQLPETAKAIQSGSLRQRMEQHRANPTCANCHAKMDAMGFAFENFDAIGAFRTKDAGFDIDPSGVLPGGQKFQGAADLKKVLREKKDLFARCLTEKMLTYALGRGLEHYDRRTVDCIVAALDNRDYKFSALVTEIVHSDPFRLRRGKALK
jgi:hypothetical protein